MLITGIGLSGYGIVGLIYLFLQIQKASNNAYIRINEEALLKLFTTDIIALTIGIILIIFGIMRSRNKNALDKLTNKEKNSIEQAKCKSCGLNLSENTKICPRCGAHID